MQLNSPNPNSLAGKLKLIQLISHTIVRENIKVLKKKTVVTNLSVGFLLLFAQNASAEAIKEIAALQSFRLTSGY